MTRKQALFAAIAVLETPSATEPGRQLPAAAREEIVDGLRRCADELPFTRWSEAAIFDACDEFLRTHPYIRLKDFDRAGLPSHTVIRNRFGMSAKEFRDRYYPITDVTTRSRYFARPVAEWNERFRAEYRRLGAPGGDEYNRRRNRALPSWNTLAAMNGVRRWSELLAALDLRREDVRPEIAVRIVGEEP